MKVIHFIGINRKFRIAGFLSAFLLVTLCGLTLLPVSFQDKHAEAATGTATESTITLDVVNSVASVDLTVNSSNGTFATSASNDEASFSVVTNNYTGYTLSISANDNTGELVNGEESLSSIESAISASTFDSSTYNGLWGYKPSKLNSTSNTNYLPSPTTEATTLDVTNSANNEANAYTIGLGARTDYSKPNGTYSKTFILTAVANKINYSVTYNKNTTDTVTNMPYSNTDNVQSGDTGSTSITLSDLVPVRDGYNFKGWCSVATSDETCSGTTYNPDGAGTNLTYGIDQTTLNIGTLYAMWQSAETKCDPTKLCVQYEGNGLTYDGGKTVNRVNYNSSTSQQEMTKILHSDNVNDSGIATSNSAVNIDQTKEATIDGASSVNVSLYYDTEGEDYDWVTLYAGADSVPSSSNDGTIESNGNLTGKLGGNKSGYTTSYTTWNLWNNSGNPINSDTIKIHFVTDNYADAEYISYGYYAIITGTSVINTRSVASGEYSTPTGTNAIFRGWSSIQTTAGAGTSSQAEYTDESEVLSKMPGNEGDAKTLYAVWQQGYSITFNKDSNVSSIAVLDSDGNTVGTITSSGQSLTLASGDTYTIKPAHTIGYATNTITKTSGFGTLDGKEFTVGAGTAVISITSREAFLYNEVAALSKGKNTDSSSHFSWTSITAPTTANPATDTSTSGVFEWDGKTAGNGVDSNGGSQKIYFYRGVLETNPGTYGSDGTANAYPNYVKLANNTCWRIVRTTSTGGVKIIYNGMWNESTSTCANTQTAAQFTTSLFNNSSVTTIDGNRYTGLQNNNIHAAGYTYSNLAAGTTDATPISTIFGSSGNDTTTNTNSSIIKQEIEDWYEDNMTDYTPKLEGDAGYCNDRTLNTGESWTTPLADTDTIVPYGTSNYKATEYYFGSYPRNANQSTFSPTLTCPRGKVDLYSYTSNAGNGNGQLSYPVALLTADEASLVGSGRDNSYSAYNANSYLSSGSDFWLLSPQYRASYLGAYGFCVYSNGRLGNTNVGTPTSGIRPVISLSSGTRIYSGSGTATDPWVVQ